MASPQTVATARTGSLAQSIAVGATPTTILIDITENWGVTSGVVRVGVGDSREWFSFTGLTVVTANSRIQLTGVTRALKKNATSLTDNDTATYAKSHAIGSKVILTQHSAQINKLVQEDADNTISGDNTLTGTNSFVSTSKATLITQNVTEAQRDALTGVTDGAEVYNTDNGTQDVYIGGSWQHLSTGTASNASETTAGVVELATVAEQGSAASTGGTGAPTVVQTQYLIGTSAGSGDENKIAILDSSGKYDSSFMPDSSTKFGGDGSDGAISGSGVTVTGSNNTYIVKNYTSFSPGSNTVTVTPTGCIVHIKVSGDADLTNTTFNFSGKGATAGSGGAGGSGSGTAGTVGSDSIGFIVNSLAGNYGTGGTAGADSTGGAATSLSYPLSTDMDALILGSRSILVTPGGGGGGGGGGSGTTSTSEGGAGGAGGAGGGCLILEVAGDLTLSSTTFDCSGVDGTDGTDAEDNGANSAGGGGAGGGGGGGSCIVLYGGTLTGSSTLDVSGGSGGTGGTSYLNDGGNPRYGGGGGSGGSSVWANGTAGTAGGSSGPAGTGGNGGAGQYLIAKNTVFQ